MGPPPDTGPEPDAAPLCWRDAAPNDADPQRYPPGAYPIPFALEPAGGTVVELRTLELSDPIPIGFELRFFDERHSSLRVSSRGYLTFSDTTLGCCITTRIPSLDGYDDLIAYGWSDYSLAEGGTVTYETRGEAPNRRLVITATDQSWCCDTGDRATTQIVVDEATGYIDIHTPHFPAGHPRTVGVENGTGCDGFVWEATESTLNVRNDAVRFVTY